MTLFDCSSGRILSIGGDGDSHARLVDFGLVGSVVSVKARARTAVLVDFGEFRASVGNITAKQIVISEGVNEDRALRKPKRRKDDGI